MPSLPPQTPWWRLTPIQRALLQRVRRQGVLDRLMPWEGRTVRSLVGRDLLRRQERTGSRGWVLTPRARRIMPAAAAAMEDASSLPSMKIVSLTNV